MWPACVRVVAGSTCRLVVLGLLGRVDLVSGRGGQCVEAVQAGQEQPCPGRRG